MPGRSGAEIDALRVDEALEIVEAWADLHGVTTETTQPDMPNGMETLRSFLQRRHPEDD